MYVRVFFSFRASAFLFKHVCIKVTFSMKTIILEIHIFVFLCLNYLISFLFIFVCFFYFNRMDIHRDVAHLSMMLVLKQLWSSKPKNLCLKRLAKRQMVSEIYTKQLTIDIFDDKFLKKHTPNSLST